LNAAVPLYIEEHPIELLQLCLLYSDNVNSWFVLFFHVSV